MVNEELLQFIREQQAAGMAQDTIENFLISEGGWDRSDINEAYRVLNPAPLSVAVTAPAAPINIIEPAPIASPVQTPPGSSVGQEAVLRDSRNIVALWPATSEEASASRTAAKNDSPLQVNLDKILSGATSGRISVQTNVSHAEFPGSPFSMTTEPAAGLSEQKEKNVGQISAGIEKKETEKSVSSPVSGMTSSPFSPPAFSAENKVATSLPLQNQPRGDIRAFSSPKIPETSPVAPLKLNLDALRKNIFQEQKTPPAPSFENVHNSVKSSAGHSQGVPVDEVQEKPKASFIGSSPVASLTQEKNKNPAPKARTMISDLLSREKETAASGTPAVPEPHEAFSPGVSDKKKEDLTVSPAPSLAAPITFPPFEDDVLHHARIKQMVTTAVLVVIAVLLLGGGVFAFMKYRTPDAHVLFNAALTQFFANSSFTYKGKAATDLALSAVSGGIVENGAMKFSVKLEGIVANEKSGYGDGEHTIALLGGWQWADSLLSTDLSADLRLISDTLYFHILSLPAKDDLDPEFFKDNWLKVDVADLRKELRISGVSSGVETEEYGSFGGTNEGSSFNALLQKFAPLKTTGSPTGEMLGGVPTMHIRVQADREGMAAFVRALYQKYFNKDLILSEDQLLRFQDALAKISGDVWINEETGVLEKIILSANFDDDIAGIHAQGPVSLEFTFTDVNQPVAVDIPQSVLTLPDVRVKMNEFQMTKEMRVRDQVKVGHMLTLEDALESYRREIGRYPKTLTDLYAAGKLATSTIDVMSLQDYSYRSYQKAPVSGKMTQCLTSGKVCAFYHLGTSLEEVTNSMLKSDADLTTAIEGSDGAGCGKEADRACYDVVAPVLQVVTSTPATVSPPSANP